MPNEKGEKGAIETSDIETGVSVDISDDVKEQLTPELQAAIKAGAPIVIIVRNTPGGLKVKDTRTFEKGYNSANKAKIEGKADVAQKDLLDIIEAHKFMEDSIREVKKDCDEQIKKMTIERDKAYQEAAHNRKDLKKRKDKIRDMKQDHKDLYDKHKD